MSSKNTASTKEVKAIDQGGGSNTQTSEGPSKPPPGKGNTEKKDSSD